MPRYFIVANSFAAPWVSDTSMCFQGGSTPEDALETFAASYNHPAGLYAAELYADANAYHDGHQPLARWLSNHEQALQAATKGKDAYSYYGHQPRCFKVDHKVIEIEKPKKGSLV